MAEASQYSVRGWLGCVGLTRVPTMVVTLMTKAMVSNSTRFSTAASALKEAITDLPFCSSQVGNPSPDLRQDF